MDFFRDWHARAMWSCVAPPTPFGRPSRDKIDGTVAHGTYALHTSLSNEMSNMIKVIKRMACGYRDEYSFFLKALAAFPGIPGSTTLGDGQPAGSQLGKGEDRDVQPRERFAHPVLLPESWSHDKHLLRIADWQPAAKTSLTPTSLASDGSALDDVQRLKYPWPEIA
jgi:hypothetical protein